MIDDFFWPYQIFFHILVSRKSFGAFALCQKYHGHTVMVHNVDVGSFNNQVDNILAIFDPLPPLGGQIWTFLTPFSYVQMDIVDICQPPFPLFLSMWLLNDPHTQVHI